LQQQDNDVTDNKRCTELVSEQRVHEGIHCAVREPNEMNKKHSKEEVLTLEEADRLDLTCEGHEVEW